MKTSKMAKRIARIVASRKHATDHSPEPDPTVMTRKEMKDFLKHS